MENTLHQAIIDIENSITLLIAPRYDTVETHTGHRTITKASLYTEMRESVDARPFNPDEAGSFTPISKPPLWIPALDWIHTVDKTVRTWTTTGKDTFERLNNIIENTWRPQDTQQLNTWSTTIKEWVEEADELLDERSTFDVAAACPECGVDVVWRPNLLGENTRRPALRVSHSKGCTCLNCGKHWPYRTLGLLASQLNTTIKTS